MNTIIIFLFILHLVSLRIALRRIKQVNYSFQELMYLLDRGYREDDYSLPTVAPGMSDDEVKNNPKAIYNRRIHETRDIFISEVSFLIYYTSVAVLSLITVFYLMGII